MEKLKNLSLLQVSNNYLVKTKQVNFQALLYLGLFMTNIFLIWSKGKIFSLMILFALFTLGLIIFAWIKNINDKNRSARILIGKVMSMHATRHSSSGTWVKLDVGGKVEEYEMYDIFYDDIEENKTYKFILTDKDVIMGYDDVLLKSNNILDKNFKNIYVTIWIFKILFILTSLPIIYWVCVNTNIF